MNPSIARDGARLVMVQRTVNSRLIDGRYETANGEPFETRNFLLRLNDELGTEHSAEILPPVDMPPPRFPHPRALAPSTRIRRIICAAMVKNWLRCCQSTFLTSTSRR